MSIWLFWEGEEGVGWVMKIIARSRYARMDWVRRWWWWVPLPGDGMG